MNKQNLDWRLLSLPYNEGVNKVLQQHYHAAQFIAMAGRHLIKQEEDDSNTNMEYLAAQEMLIGNYLPNGFRISLHLNKLNLCVMDSKNQCKNTLTLVGKTKVQVFEELKNLLEESGINILNFINALHYELPKHELNDGATFSVKDKIHSQENTNYRHNADIIIIKIASGFENASQVRIWPHHFDTGSSIPLTYNKKGVVSSSIGIGWAIPDAMVSEPYYYLSFWSEDSVKDFKNLPSPDAGEWSKTGWAGGILTNADLLKFKTPEAQQEQVISFFKSGIKILLNH